jgi:glycosyltransferase involved in cell wall biosynthesis
MADKIGVLFIVAQEEFGADSAVHADIIRNLDRDKFSVHVACTDGGGNRVPPSLAVMQKISDINLRPTRFAPSFRQSDRKALIRSAGSVARMSTDFVALRQYIAREGIRIVHSTERPRDAAYNIALSKLARVRSVVQVHVKWSEEYTPLAKWGVRNADAVFSISRYVTGTLLKMRIPRETIHTVLNGIDPGKWDPSTDGQALRRELGISEEALLLASVSRLFSWKGQRELVRAFALVRKECPDAELVIVGADYTLLEPNSFTAELKDLAQRLGVLEHVRFTGGRSDIPNVMAACDVFALPSFEEPFGLVYLEAMAMRKPVVAIDNGGTPEVVENGRSGLLSPPWDISALAANIVRLLQDRKLREQMGSHGRERMLAHFSARRMAHDAGAAYERILNGEPSAS